ncbi:ferritin-like domain-containing protein [Flavobacterium weaverense]|uniref:Ferritin-like metal-binding protein YciE n=1 Tax=Flavobacterium weaverense TaxID=271156 RepID=A0A3L9ZJV4_9FLAO|nr:ferritin-like domain-containing protein [Flavobacterium weaverense]RMA71659.1 ferritin-like metal-binding protein YciE [Flavobacterium weaverense]
MKNSEKPKQHDKKIEDKDDKLIVQPAKNAAATLKDLFIESLKDIYWAENALVSALPKMAANATAVALKSAINDHLSVTKNQVARLQNIFDLLGEKAVGKKCDAMEGLLKEGDSIMEGTMPGAVRDAGIISASQKIEHYEIATYGTLVAFAKALGENDVAKLLTQTLAEEKESDTVLNDVALNAVNNRAVKNK